jgi:hypothetical protein
MICLKTHSILEIAIQIRLTEPAQDVVVQHFEN